MDYIISFFSEAGRFYWEIAPYLIFGFAVAAAIHVLFPESFIMRHLGAGTFGSVIKSTLAGIPVPLCSCGVIPVAASLRKKGASNGAAVSFLIATPQIGADSYMITWSLIGPIFAAFRIAAAFITAMAAGIATNLLGGSAEQVKAAAAPAVQSSVRDRIHSIFSFMQFELFGAIARSLFTGILIAGAIAVFIPATFFSRYLGNEMLSMLLMLVVGIPMYVCATASTPIAASLIMKGISPGAALVFLLTGPATNAVTIATVNRVMGKKVTAIYLSAIAVVSILLGMLINRFTNVGIAAMAGHQHDMLPTWVNTAGTVLLTAMFVIHAAVLIKRKFTNTTAEDTMDDKITVNVNGMTCMHCAANVKRAVESVKGTGDVNVDLDGKKVTFTFASDKIDAIRKAIEDNGYQVTN